MDSIPDWDKTISALDDEGRSALHRLMRPTQFRRASFLFEEGKPAEHLFVIRVGRVKTCFSDSAGRDHTGRVFGPGRLLGIVTNLTGSPPAVSIQAIDHVEAAAIIREDFLDAMRQLPEFSLSIARLVSTMGMEWVNSSKVTVDSAPIRLGKVLKDLARLEGAPLGGHEAVVRGMTHQELASIVGASRTWVSLMLSTLEDKGLVDCGRGVIRIPDLPALDLHIHTLERSA